MAQMMTELIENRKQKNSLLQQLLELTQLEKDQLEADQVEELADTTRQWEKLSAQVDRLDVAYQNALRPLAVQDPARPLGKDTAAFEQLNAEGLALLTRMQEMQIACNTLAAEKMERYKTDLKDAQKTTQRVNSYANPYSISEDGIYFDQKK